MLHSVIRYSMFSAVAVIVFMLSILILSLMIGYVVFLFYGSGNGIFSINIPGIVSGSGDGSKFYVFVGPVVLILSALFLVYIFYNIWKRKSYSAKILDSSVFVDGRVVDLIKFSFLEGPFVIPKFILSELHRLSDSENSVRRLKGRLALENVAIIQKLPGISVSIDNKDYKIRDVDTKLIKLAKKRGAKIITTDFNLTKVAEIQMVKVLNLNTISSLIKKIIVPNEEFEIELIKKGDKDGQLIGYLEDGTMVVVTDAGDRLGKKVRIITVNTYPTQAGRIVFGRIK